MINQVMYWIEFQLDEHSDLISRRINSKKKVILDLQVEIPRDQRWGQKLGGSV